MSLRVALALAAPLGLAAAAASMPTLDASCKDAPDGSCDAGSEHVALLQHSVGVHGGQTAGGAGRLGRGRALAAGASDDAAEAKRGPALSWPNPDFSPPMIDVFASFSSIGDQGSVITARATGFPAGYDKAVAPYSEHFEGVERYKDYLYISGAGEHSKTSQIFVLEIGSKGAKGPLSSGDEFNVDPKDKYVKVLDFDSANIHPGGFSIYGDILAVGSEKGCSTMNRLFHRCKLSSEVHFFDLADPLNPKLLDYNLVRDTDTAGTVALTQEPDGRYLLMVGNGDSKRLDFYRTEQPLSNFPRSSDPGFNLVASWDPKSMLVSAGESDKWHSYQNLNFVRQADGTIFIVATTRTLMGSELGSDIADLLMLDNRARDSMTLTKVGSKHLRCAHASCNFYSGAGTYVESATMLRLYATNWEPLKGKTAILVNEFSSA